MTVVTLPQGGDARTVWQGWGLSTAVHITLAAAIVFAMQQITPPKDPPFRWNVAMVEPPLPAPAPTPEPTVQPEPPRPVTPPRPRQVVQDTPPPTPQVMTREVVSRTVPAPVERAEPTPEVKQIQPVVQERQVVQQQETPKAVERVTEVATTPTAQVVEQHTAVVEHATPVHAAETVMDVQAPTVVASAAPVETSVSAEAVVERTVVEAAPSAAAAVEAAAPVERAAPVVETRESASPAPIEAPAVPAPVEAPAPPVVATAPEPVRTEEHQMVAKVVPQHKTPSKADYAWLADSLHRRIVELRHYPSTARLNGWEGKVVLRVTLKSNGELEQVSIVKSSGYESLDNAAIEAVRRACPLHMKQQITTPNVVVNVPINYSLSQ